MWTRWTGCASCAAPGEQSDASVQPLPMENSPLGIHTMPGGGGPPAAGSPAAAGASGAANSASAMMDAPPVSGEPWWPARCMPHGRGPGGDVNAHDPLGLAVAPLPAGVAPARGRAWTTAAARRACRARHAPGDMASQCWKERKKMNPTATSPPATWSRISSALVRRSQRPMRVSASRKVRLQTAAIAVGLQCSILGSEPRVNPMPGPPAASPMARHARRALPSSGRSCPAGTGSPAGRSAAGRQAPPPAVPASAPPPACAARKQPFMPSTSPCR